MNIYFVNSYSHNYRMMGAVGNWFFPNGTRVPSSGADWDFHRTRGHMVVYLHRRKGAMEGVYRCEIPDSTNIIQTIYIEVYTPKSRECETPI